MLKNVPFLNQRNKIPGPLDINEYQIASEEDPIIKLEGTLHSAYLRHANRFLKIHVPEQESGLYCLSGSPHLMELSLGASIPPYEIRPNPSITFNIILPKANYMIMTAQGKRIDDQECAITVNGSVVGNVFHKQYF